MGLLRLFRGDTKTTDDLEVYTDRTSKHSIALSDIEENGVVNSGPDDDIKVTYGAPHERATWSGKLDFIMTCIGYAVGLGNVWRFPYLCYKNGGGAFLIPYCFMLALIGLPLFFFEFAIGQFASLGPISVWNISPLFRGIGHAMVLVSWILVIYYQVVIAHCLYFMIASMQAVLPWTHCPTTAQIGNCVELTNTTLSSNASALAGTSPSEYYYYNVVLNLSDGIDDIGVPTWYLALALLCAWIISALAVIKGVQSLGKVSYFTSVFPYLILTAMLIRSLLLPGSMDGIVFYLKPEFSRLLEPRVWVDAATQIFFSIGCCNGSLIAMSSFNKFKNNCCRDAVIVAAINCATSVYAGFVIFANLGFMAYTKNTTVGEVARDGPGLAFVVYPEALTEMPLPTLWAILFFFMMCTLGFGSQFSTLEAVISGLQVELRRIGYVFSSYRQIIFRCLICSVNFLLGLPMVCSGGFYLFYLVDNFLSSYPLLVIALAETVVICHIYGLRQFRRDIEMMINERPNWYWRICWMFVTPLLCAALVIFLFITNKPLVFNTYTYPYWALALGNLVAASPVCLIILWFLYKYCREGGFILMREFFKPAFDWGPAQNEHRAEFLTNLRFRVHRSAQLGLTNMDDGGSTAPLATVCAATNNGGGTGGNFNCGGAELGGSVISGLAGTGIIDDTGFFQSKLSVAEKLTHAHTKEVLKRAASNAEFPSTDALAALTSSQTLLATSVALIASGACAPGGQPGNPTAPEQIPQPSPTAASNTVPPQSREVISIYSFDDSPGTAMKSPAVTFTVNSDGGSELPPVNTSARDHAAIGAFGNVNTFTTNLSPVREAERHQQSLSGTSSRPDAKQQKQDTSECAQTENTARL